MPTVKIILTAEQKQAVAAFQQLKEQVNVGKDALQSLSNAGRAFGSQVAPQLTAGVAAVSDAFKALSGSAKMGAAAMGAYAIGAGAVIMGWKTAIDSVRESFQKFDEDVKNRKAEQDWVVRRKELLSYIDALQKAGKIGAEEARGLTADVLTAGNAEQRGNLSRSLQSRVNATREQIEAEKVKAGTELETLLNELQAKLLSGADLERAKINKELDALVAKGTEAATKLGISNQPLLDLASQVLNKNYAEIDAKALQDNVDKQRKLAEEQARMNQEIRAREQRADEFYKREEEHAQRMVEAERQRTIRAIERNQFLTDSERYNQLSNAGADLSGVANPSSFSDQMGSGLAQLSSAWEFAGSAARVALEGMQGAVNAVSSGIMGAIDGTMTWGQAFTQVARQIISSLIQIVVQWIAQQTIVRALRAVFTTESAGQAALTEQAWAPAAYAASVATYGYAAAVGAASVIAGLGTTIAAFMSTGFMEGGYTGDGPRDKVAGVVHYGEVVIPADVVNQFRTGSSSPIENAPQGGSSANAAGQIYVVNVNDQSELARFMESHMGERIVVNHVFRNRGDLGMQS
jgi:hypothetical protein